MNNKQLEGYTDIVYAPNYISSSEGILQLPEDDLNFELNTYLVFNQKIYKTQEDFKQAIIQLLENNSNTPYNINIINSALYDCIQVSCIYGSLNIYIPTIKPENKLIQEQIIRDYLLKEAYLNGRIIVYRCPFRSLNELILDMRNIFIR